MYVLQRVITAVIENPPNAKCILVRWDKDEDELFLHIETGDVTWISYITGESKQQYMQWRHSGLPKPNKIKQNLQNHANCIQGPKTRSSC